MTEYKSNLWKFYIASILGGFAYFYNGIDTLYYRHFHLSFEQIGFLISASLIATLICEIPTGSFADVYGKKKSILLGSLAVLIGLGFLAFGSNLNAFTVGFILVGVGRAFNSGAGNALLYDFLNSMDKQHEYLKHQSRIQSAFVGIDIISGSLGFLLFAINIRIPFIISFIAMALVIMVQLSMKEVLIKKVYQGNMFITHINQIKEGFLITIKSNIILWFMGFTLIYFITNKFFAEVISLPFLTEIKHFNTNQLAILGLIANSIQTATIFFINHIEKRLQQGLSLITTVVVTSAVLFGLLLSHNYLLSGVIMGLFWGTASFREIIIDSYLNKHISSSHRATVLSINSMISSGIAVIVLPLLGYFADKSGVSNGMALLAVGTLIFGGIIFLMKRNSKLSVAYQATSD